MGCFAQTRQVLLSATSSVSPRVVCSPKTFSEAPEEITGKCKSAPKTCCGHFSSKQKKLHVCFGLRTHLICVRRLRGFVVTLFEDLSTFNFPYSVAWLRCVCHHRTGLQPLPTTFQQNYKICNSLKLVLIVFCLFVCLFYPG